MKQAFFSTVLLLLLSNISYSQDISQTDKLTPKDFVEIFSLALNLPELQQYYHVVQYPSRSQIIFKDFGKANHNNLKGLIKFNKQVLIMTENELKQKKVLNYFVLGDWVCGTNSVRLQLSYVGEGLLISYMFKKAKNQWRIDKFDLSEE